MENVKAMGLMAQVAKGLLNHSGSATAAQLGDRSKYVGLSDIGIFFVPSSMNSRVKATGIFLGRSIFRRLKVGLVARDNSSSEKSMYLRSIYRS